MVDTRSVYEQELFRVQQRPEQIFVALLGRGALVQERLTRLAFADRAIWMGEMLALDLSIFDNL